MTVETIDRLLFRDIKDTGEKADCILVLGSSKAAKYRVPVAAQAYNAGRSGKMMLCGGIFQLLRNPIYAQADLDMYEFFKSQGTVVVNEATDFSGTNGCYLYQGRDVQERKNKHLKDQILVLAPSEGLVSSDTWLRYRKKLMANKTFQGGRKAKNTWLAGKVKCGRCGYALIFILWSIRDFAIKNLSPPGYQQLRLMALHRWLVCLLHHVFVKNK